MPTPGLAAARSFDELKKFVEETLEVKCIVETPDGCSEKEVEFIGKWKGKPAADVTAQLDRLTPMLSGSVKPELKKWIGQRVNVLKQLSA